MADEFQGEICGANWWNPPRCLFSPLPSPCSMAGGLGHVDEGYGWPMSHHVIDHDQSKARSNSSGETNNSVSESPNMVFQEVLQKPHHQADQIMGFGLSPPDLIHPNLAMGRSENNTTSAMYSLFHDDMGAKLSNTTGSPAAFFGYDSSTLLQNLFDGESQQLPLGSRSLSYSSPNYASNNGSNVPATKPLYFSNNTQFWNASSDNVLSEGNVRPSLHFPPVTQPQQYGSPEFEQKAKGNGNLAAAAKPDHMVSRGEVHQELASLGAVKGGERDQPAAVKRARIETPSPLPTFKVRKEKLGDRITALQQLVSPFGKTDTASVLHEAIEYVKFLHDQVSVLSTPYMKNGTPIQAHQQGPTRLKDQKNQKQDLKSLGLCLVPISSTFPMANETTPDFWTPTFGGTFR